MDRARSSAISGCVRDLNGAAIEAAAVRLQPVAGGSAPRLARTNAQGCYRLHAPAGEYVLEVQRGGFAASRAPLQASALPTARDVTLRPGAKLSGRVRKVGAGEPVAGATVQLVADSRRTPHPPMTVRTDAEGAFHLVDVPPGIAQLTATSTELSSRRAALVPLGTGESEGAVELWVDTAYVARGTIHDSGAPPRHAGVQLVAISQADASATSSHGLTDASGRFEVQGLAPGAYRLQAYRGRELLEIDGEGARLDIFDGPPLERQLRFRAGTPHSAAPQSGAASQPKVRVAGYVIDDKGRPLVDATLVFMTTQMRSSEGGPRNVLHQARTHRGGAFELALDDGSDYEFAVRDRYGERRWAKPLPERQGQRFRRVAVSRGEKQLDLVLRVEHCRAVLAGRLVDEKRRPLPHASFALRRQEVNDRRLPPLGDTNGDWQTSDGHGRFRVSDLCDGNYELAGSSDAGELHALATASIPLDGELELRLQPRVTWAGRVTFQGAAVAAFDLSLAGPAELQQRIVAEDGSFRIESLPVGQYEALVSSNQGYAVQSVWLDGGHEGPLDIALGAWSSLRGRVSVGSPGGAALVREVEAVLEPAGGAGTDLLGPAVRIRQARVESDGSFELPQLIAGRGYLAFGGSGRRPLVAGQVSDGQGGVALLGSSPWYNFQVSPAAQVDVGVIELEP